MATNGSVTTVAVGLATAVLAGSASGMSLPADVGQRIQVVSSQEACVDGGSTAVQICASSDSGSLSANLTGSFNRQISAQVSSNMNGFVASFASIPGATARGTLLPQSAILSMVQFDDFIVSGPTPSVEIGVVGRVTGTSSNLAGASTGDWVFRIGARNPTPSAELTTYGDWVLGVPVHRYESLYTLPDTAVNATPNWTTTQTMLVQTGQSFELGLHFATYLLSVGTSFSEISWSFDVPQGYQLTSARGLAVNVSAVPEPQTLLMLLAGLAVVGVGARRMRSAG